MPWDIELERFLAEQLPRPSMEPDFAADLLRRVLDSDPGWAPVTQPAMRRRIYYYGGALAGAAALAIGAALGWRRVRTVRTPETERAA